MALEKERKICCGGHEKKPHNDLKQRYANVLITLFKIAKQRPKNGSKKAFEQS